MCGFLMLPVVGGLVRGGTCVTPIIPGVLLCRWMASALTRLASGRS